MQKMSLIIFLHFFKPDSLVSQSSALKAMSGHGQRQQTGVNFAPHSYFTYNLREELDSFLLLIYILQLSFWHPRPCNVLGRCDIVTNGVTHL